MNDDNENNVISSDDVNDIDSDSNVAEADLVIGSKKRNHRSKKTSDNSLVCRSDIDFLQMHGSSEFSSLPCNDFSNKELLRKQEDKAHNQKFYLNFIFLFFLLIVFEIYFRFLKKLIILSLIFKNSPSSPLTTSKRHNT